MKNSSSIQTNIMLGITALVFILFSGCATVGKNFKSEQVNQLKIGVSKKADIINMFGEPFKATSGSSEGLDSEILSYVYAKGTMNSATVRVLSIELVDELINAYVFRSSMKEDLKDFDINSRKKIVAGESTKSDVIKLLGQPHGILKLPSKLINHDFGGIYKYEDPKNAKVAVVYNHSTTKKVNGILQTHFKLLVVYLSESNTVIDVQYYDGVI